MAEHRLFRGIAKYEIFSEDKRNFINCVNESICLKSIRITSENTIVLTCFYSQHKSFEEMAEHFGCTIVRKSCYGVPVVVEKIAKRPGIPLCLLLSAVIMLASTMFVWEIRVEGNERLSGGEIMRMLYKAGLSEGMSKHSLDVKRIADRVLINENEISWLAINLDGTVAHVEIKEAKIAKSFEKKENVNLVASANAIIMRVDALGGTAAVKKGEAVVKGQLLVSAFVDKRTGGSLLTGARGFVWANTQREICSVVPLEYKVKKYTGRENKSLYVTLLGKTLLFCNPFAPDLDKCDFTKKSHRIKLFGKFYLPITVTEISHREYTLHKRKRSEREALLCAQKSARECLNHVSPQLALAGFSEEYAAEQGKLVYKCTFDGVENIARELEFYTLTDKSE